jgi:hypothetical protein
MQHTTKTRKPDAFDIITDMVQRIAPLVANAQALATVEKDLRNTWGGDRVYIPHRRGAESGQLHSERNSRIIRAYQQGRHIAYMARQEGLTERRVLQIVGVLRANNTAIITAAAPATNTETTPKPRKK